MVKGRMGQRVRLYVRAPSSTSRGPSPTSTRTRRWCDHCQRPQPHHQPTDFHHVETVVLEGHNVVEALARFAAESGVHTLVLGSASLS
ncbi:hypothetical protein ZWY2020_056630 [Hordeum vulgare]|nr:hypothetical protein ZWY2020_056630 [Hordeum vulgare]